MLNFQQTFTRRLWCLALGAAALSACADDGPLDDGSGPETQSELETQVFHSQCGATWDAQPVERYNGSLGPTQAFVATHERRVGQGFGNKGSCTGTLISDDLFLSAGHCGYAPGNTVRFDFQNDAAGNPRTPVTFAVASVVEQEYDPSNPTWDYAILRLHGSPGREFGHASIAPVDPAVNSTVTIIQHPSGRPKEVHAGPITSISGLRLYDQVDTESGSSGSGMLDTEGRLVGVWTNHGCGATSGSNFGMRMSQLVPHSATLQVLAGSRLLFRTAEGKVALWRLNHQGLVTANQIHGPFAGWNPVGLTGNRLLWRHSDGHASLWRLNDDGTMASFTEHGPFDGWSVVNYSNERLLWKHTSGKISLWTLTPQDEFNGFVEYGPFDGWTVVNYANNRLLWRHTNGNISFWVLNRDNQKINERSREHVVSGWRATSYDNGELLWTDGTGRTSQWIMGRDGAQLSFQEQGPFSGFQPMALRDRRLIWWKLSGGVSYWSVNWSGGNIGNVNLSAGNDWLPLLTAGATPL